MGTLLTVLFIIWLILVVAVVLEAAGKRRGWYL